MYAKIHITAWGWEILNFESNWLIEITLECHRIRSVRPCARIHELAACRCCQPGKRLAALALARVAAAAEAASRRPLVPCALRGAGGSPSTPLRRPRRGACAGRGSRCRAAAAAQKSEHRVCVCDDKICLHRIDCSALPLPSGEEKEEQKEEKERESCASGYFIAWLQSGA